MDEDPIYMLLSMLYGDESHMDAEMHHALDDIEYDVKILLEPVCRYLVIDWSLDCWGSDSCKAVYRITCSGKTYRVVAYVSDYHTAYVDSIKHEGGEDEQ
jgi:hypothetical protein